MQFYEWIYPWSSRHTVCPSPLASSVCAPAPLPRRVLGEETRADRAQSRAMQFVLTLSKISAWCFTCWQWPVSASALTIDFFSSCCTYSGWNLCPATPLPGGQRSVPTTGGQTETTRRRGRPTAHGKSASNFNHVKIFNSVKQSLKFSQFLEYLWIF